MTWYQLKRFLSRQVLGTAAFRTRLEAATTRIRVGCGRASAPPARGFLQHPESLGS